MLIFILDIVDKLFEVGIFEAKKDPQPEKIAKFSRLPCCVQSKIPEFCTRPFVLLRYGPRLFNYKSRQEPLVTAWDASTHILRILTFLYICTLYWLNRILCWQCSAQKCSYVVNCIYSYYTVRVRN